jgi:hypothetical protein
MPKRNVTAGRGAAQPQTAQPVRSRQAASGRPGNPCGCSPVLALFSVIGAMQLVVLVYFLSGYVTGPAAPPAESKKFLDEIDADAPEGIRRNAVRHSDPVGSDSGSGNSGGSSVGSSGGGSSSGGSSGSGGSGSRDTPASQSASNGAFVQRSNNIRGSAAVKEAAAEDFVDDGTWSSYNVRYRNAPRSVFEQPANAQYSSNDAWLNARPAWVNNPLRERPQVASASSWDAAAKSAPKFPSRAALEKVFADVERLYIAETEATLEKAQAVHSGLFVLQPAQPVPGISGGPVCLDNLGHGVGEGVGVFACHGQGGSQAWSLSGGRVCQISVKKEVCLTVVEDNGGYAVKFQPTSDLSHPTALLDAQLWDMKMKTVHGDISIKSRVAAPSAPDGLCLAVQANAAAGSIPEVQAVACASSSTASWSKAVYKVEPGNSGGKAVDPDYEEYAFNKPLSMKIGTHREEPERRPPQCKNGAVAWQSWRRRRWRRRRWWWWWRWWCFSWWWQSFMVLRCDVLCLHARRVVVCVVSRAVACLRVA